MASIRLEVVCAASSSPSLFSAASAPASPRNPAPVEIFDRSGLPTRPQTDTERQLMRRISAHKPGDMAGAAAIQRDLAAYYRGKGDDRRSRAAQATGFR